MKWYCLASLLHSTGTLDVLASIDSAKQMFGSQTQRRRRNKLLAPLVFAAGMYTLFHEQVCSWPGSKPDATDHKHKAKKRDIYSSSLSTCPWTSRPRPFYFFSPFS